MKKLLILSAIIASSFCKKSFAQAKSIFFEVGGPGLASVNFDTRFTKSEKGIGGRLGIGAFNVDGASAVFIPLGVNYLLSKDERNYFEIGGGVTPVIINGNDDDGSLTGTFGHLNFGYRLQPKEGGFLFRAAIVPVFGSGFFWPYYAGVSFGYKF